MRNSLNSLPKGYYMYRHIRVDTNEVFYIGIGTKNNKQYKTITSEYKRAYVKFNRSGYWKDIVNQSDYEVEILFEHDNYEVIKQKEIEFIALYKRQDCCGGTLVNLTDGGEGNTGVIISEEQRKALSERSKGSKNYWYGSKRNKELNPFYGKFHSEESLIKMRGERPSITCGNHKNANKVLKMSTGFIYACTREASELEGINYSSLRAYLNGAVNNRTDLISLNLEDYDIYCKYFK